MLPAENQENQAATAVTNSNALAPSGFGKVLSSIKGLQERLNDFTLDDVISAEINLKTLMQQILLMRDRLSNISELKSAVINANQLIHDIPEENFDFVGPDGLEKHPQLHAIVKASKLIRFHRLMKAARASADAVSFDAEAGELHIDTAAAKIMPAAPAREIIQDENKVAPETTLAVTESLVQLGAEENAQAIVIEAPAEWTFEAAKSETKHSSTPRDETAPNFTLMNADESAAVEASAKAADKDHAASGNLATLSAAEFPIHAALQPAITVATLPAALIEAPENFPPADAAPMGPPARTTISEAEKPSHLSRKQKKQAKNKKQSEAETQLDESRALVPANTDINQQLLDDLIENYGDFATTPNLPAPVQAHKAAKIKSFEPTVLPAPELDKPLEDRRSAPNLQKAGELDRQLKKIIKDYGEYDLYSKQSPLNLKTGGIAVFVLLGLVLGGIYLFKAPTTAGSSQTNAVTQPSQVAPADSAKASLNDKRNGVTGATKNGNREEAAAAAKTVTKQKK